MKTRFLFLLILAFFTSGLFAAEKIGADAAAPAIAAALAALKTPPGTSRVLTEAETRSLITLAAQLSINVFELLDGTYRYASSEGVRFILSGVSLRSASTFFSMGGERVESLLPIEKTDRVELGATLVFGQEAMDVYLTQPHSDFIELGTAVMERRFGFKRLEPKLFAEAYGVKVKRFPISTELDRLELYAPAKGAIYVKALNRPKRWNLNVIRFL
jgi:hypothetical protein